ncbi:MAG TPA: NAD(P)-dependent oxidoreductase [Nitrospiraceae bacterium]|nr:NAD(P)-dependent oxidoreductase [Nitrospiraceae bacterium]
MQITTPVKRTHIIMTGGAGFIGSHLSSIFLSKGADVTILTRHPEASRARQLARQGARVMACDLSRQDGLSCINDLPHGGRVIHLAADVSVNGAGLWAANVEGTKRALELARTLNASHVTVASSIEALGLGSDAEGPLSEEASCRPVSQYGMSKARAEELSAEWRSPSGKPALVLRIGNIYGPGSAWLLEPVLSALVNRDAVRHAWPELRGRRFQPLYVADLVNGMTRAIEQDLTGLYHITGEEPVTIAQYVHTVARLVGLAGAMMGWNEPVAGPSTVAGPLAPDFAYLLMGDPAHPHRCYDNGKLRRAIGPYARWSLARGLAATLKWYGTMRGWGPASASAA